MLTEHKRVKHGHTPGTINQGYLIFMREARGEYELRVFPWQVLDERCGKAFRRHIAERGRTVQRQRDQRAIRDGLADL